MGRPIDTLRIGDEIVGPYGRYHFVVTEILPSCIVGRYTLCPTHGYSVGSPAVYYKTDWHNGFEFVNETAPARAGAE